MSKPRIPGGGGGEAKPGTDGLLHFYARLVKQNRRASLLVESYESLAHDYFQYLERMTSGEGLRVGKRARSVILDARQVVGRMRVTPLADGRFDVRLDHYDPIRLPVTLGELLQLLASDAGPVSSENDRLVGFKSAQVLTDELSARLKRIVKRRALIAAISRLRDRLSRVPSGRSLIQNRPHFGWRLALIRPRSKRRRG